MKYQVVEHPSPATERLTRWAELEEMVQNLRELGWRVEKLSQVDEDGEPLRAFMRLRYDPPSALPGAL